MGGFSALLQGPSSHEALLALQDAELRLLDNVRRCVGLRVKCDREYAIALNSVCMQALKTDAIDSTELAGSLVAKAWKVMMEETEAMSRLVKQNAEHLASTTLNKINFVLAEKRVLRKLYQEERSRIDADMLQLQDAVVKSKVEYDRCLDSFKVARTKYEEVNIKGVPARGLKRADEARDRYLKACRKLYCAHNDYVLLLAEAVEQERHFRVRLLPRMLDAHQMLQEEMATYCKNILFELLQFTDQTSEKFQDTQTRICDSIQSIAASSEYKDFMDKYKSVPPLPVVFIFDRTLIEDYNGPLKPNAVAVDDLTYDDLQIRLAALEKSIEQCEQQLKEKQNQIVQFENEIASLRKTSDTASIIFEKKKTLQSLEQQVRNLDCYERKLSKQRDLIAQPMRLFEEDSARDGLAGLDYPSVRHSCPESASRCSLLASTDSLDRSQAPASNSFNSLPSTAAATGSLEPKPPLQEEEWFHGVLPREEVVRLLVNEGDFLVRETTRNAERQVVLSIRWQGHKHFIVQTTVDKHFRFEGPAFPSIQALVIHQYNSHCPVTNKSGAILRTPILKERWELKNDDIDLIDKIGRGNFGDVHKARLISTGQDVAVKTCHVTLPEDQRKKFLQEGRILKQYDHPNIVKLIGICVQKQPIMIVMELVPGGSLLNFLRTSGESLREEERLRLCVDCAAGMAYLEGNNCIHRDLAARNCLIGHNNMVKISDFGMSREEEEYIVSDGMKQIPIKWTAPEALNYGKYTSLCDVWSYGVLMWEVFSNGSTPYCGLSNSKAREMIDSGYRMPEPIGTPQGAYKLTLTCWAYDPDQRPHFAELHAALQDLLPAK